MENHFPPSVVLVNPRLILTLPEDKDVVGVHDTAQAPEPLEQVTPVAVTQEREYALDPLASDPLIQRELKMLPALSPVTVYESVPLPEDKATLSPTWVVPLYAVAVRPESVMGLSWVQEELFFSKILPEIVLTGGVTVTVNKLPDPQLE